MRQPTARQIRRAFESLDALTDRQLADTITTFRQLLPADHPLLFIAREIRDVRQEAN